MIRVVVADDQAIVRDGLVTVLDLSEDVEVVGQAADGEQAVRLVAETAPDVVLMDLRMPVLDGAGATARITAERPGTRVLVLTTFADDGSIAAALRAGAIGYLTKDAGRRELLAAVRAAAEGQAVFDPGVGARLAAGFAPKAEPPHADADALRSRFPALTAREADVLALVAQGRANPEIAAELFLSTATVKSYVTTVLAKLGAASRAEAIALVLAP
ncbi:response regulator transcription factor [Amnibacterium kyonggiense]|uniref:LuxR family two component transcriptional regulator n=1 Tax=Amnibacterium kyonggiense TaxID=595671 RepID=A0A4R7FS48_9MICO|nr:response regulator transcription factor [Amnibacterium kyonggiense]TDS80568.1 LuxR family two component transcriptional regulator [Amnibacterium kyonggiense]